MDKQPGAAGDVEHITGSAIERRADWGASAISDPTYNAEQQARNQAASALLDAVSGSSPADAGGLTRYAILGSLMNPVPHGAYVRFEDVQSLLATKAAQPTANEEGWFLPRNNLSDSVASSLNDLIRRTKRCSICNVDLRENGKNVHFEADWIKYMKQVGASPAPECSAAQYLVNVSKDVLLALRNCDREPLAVLLEGAVCGIVNSTAPSAKQEPSASEATKAQAQADLMPRREAFIKFLKARSLDEDEKVGAWGEREFKHSHIEAMWFGWFNALESDAATSASASPAAPRGHMSWAGDEAHVAAPVAGSQQAPEGFAIVPKELTKAMREAYEKNSLAPVGPISTFGYVAMIAAAPAVPVPVEQDWKPTQQQADEWADRHGLNIHGSALIVAIEDAASLHMVGAAPSLQQPKEGA